MAVNKLLRIEDYTVDKLVPLVKESLVGFVQPGKKIAGVRIFFTDGNYRRPKPDVIFYWRALYVQCIDEFDFSMKVFGDWDVYNRFKLSSAYYVKNFQPKWDEERELMIRSSALSNIVGSINEGDITNSKWLESHLTKTKATPEKPKTKDKTEELVKAIDDEVMDTIENNYKNLN